MLYQTGITCNLLRPLTKMFFLLVPYVYIIITKTKEMTVTNPGRNCIEGSR